MSAADPGLFALRSALRVAIVMPLAFALSLVVVGDKQMALFAAFGSVAMLVFVEFGGSRGARLRAYLALIAVGALLIALGTACSRSTVLATATMALVAFVILFAGVLNDYIAAAHSAAMLAFVLPVMLPAGIGALPMRLAGWGLAGALSTAATLLLWPEHPRDALRTMAGGAARELAAFIDVCAGHDHALAESARARAHDAIIAVRQRFFSLAHRPSGTASRTVALARLTQDLGWFVAVAAHTPGAADGAERLDARRTEVEGAVSAALRCLALRLERGEEPSPAVELDATRSLERVADAHAQLGAEMVAIAEGWRGEREEASATCELDEGYRLRQLSYAALMTGRDALLCCGEHVDGDPLQTRKARIGAGGRLARAHASMRSVWLRNSVRGAAGLTAAVLVAQLSDLQHSFWIVLGTMSVLRSNALATGTTIAWALLGTLAGIVAGGLLVAGVGDNRTVLWVVLPFAVALAGYAPRAISFAAGQAAFTLVVLILFNLIQPVGWKVGIVRVEDVAVGAGVSLLAGVLIWPRGAAAVLRDTLASAYGRAAEYLDATVKALLGGSPPPVLAEREAQDGAELLDSAVRDFLAERSSARAQLQELTVLVAGVNRARLIAELLQGAQAFVRLAPIDARLPRLRDARERFEAERVSVCGWYASLGTAIAQASPAPEPQTIGTQDVSRPPTRVVLEGDRGERGLPPGLAIAWAHRHLAALAELEPTLALACEHISDAGSPATR